MLDVVDAERMERVVIVGAGTAGAAIAARLSAVGTWHVTLVEAGPDYPPHVALPADLNDGTRNSLTAHDWGYRHRPTTRQRFVFPFPRGRVMGGSSAVNTCIALRGQPYDFDQWADRGLPEWRWSECLPAFKRLERDLDFDDEWHGKDGPLPIRRHAPGELVAWQAAFLEACAELGFPRCEDTNAPGSHGAGPHAMNKVDGRRVSISAAYLTAAVRSRENLTLLPDTLARRVCFQNDRVTGVEVEAGGRVRVLGADHVVLAAGAINTPGLLLRSGVGPRDELARLAVEPRAVVPGVGARLLDHAGAAFMLRPRLGAPTRRDDPLIQTVLRVGSKDSGHENDMQIQPGSAFVVPTFALPLVSVMCCVGKTRGIGTLHFPSADVLVRPRIHSRLLEDPVDRGRAVDALTLGYELSKTRVMRDIAVPFWPREGTLKRRDRLDDAVRGICDSGYHPCGTVPMGIDADPAAAADSHGRVRGVEGLRVADASLMPTVPSANTNLTVLMMGERIAEWIGLGE